jgi:hypothetical protein
MIGRIFLKDHEDFSPILALQSVRPEHDSAHSGDGKRFVAHADEKLTAFLELESATRAAAKSTLLQIIQHF